MEKTNYGHGEIREICRKSGREGGEKEGGQERYRKYPVSQRRNSAQMLQIYFSGNKRTDIQNLTSIYFSWTKSRNSIHGMYRSSNFKCSIVSSSVRKSVAVIHLQFFFFVIFLHPE